MYTGGVKRMKKFLFGTIIFFAIISLISGCGKKKTNIEPEYKFPSGWWKYEGNPPVLEIKYTDDPSDPNNKCFKIVGTTGEGNFGHVAQTIEENIPHGKKLN